MNNEERWEFLLTASRHVLAAFLLGQNPTFDQIDKLDSAVEAIDGLKVCGHRHIEDCECLKTMVR
jgi:hypothetical protein